MTRTAMVVLGLACLLPMAAEGEDLKSGSSPALIRSTRSGAWSDPQTWEGGKVPGNGSKVQVRTGHAVVYDVASDEPIRSIHVAGTLRFDTSRDTKLKVGLIKIQVGDDASENGFDCDAHMPQFDPDAVRPALEVGTPDRPVPAGHTAIIRLAVLEGMDPQTCPAIVCCGGRMDLHGAPLSQSWVKLGKTAHEGDTTVTLAEPVTGWRPGDRIIITATQRQRRERGTLQQGHGAESMPVFTEERTIRAIDGTTITLDDALDVDHLGDGNYRGEVANLSRNVIIESADPSKGRGHTMYHRNSAGSISYAEFRHLGKEGVLGKYSLHFHLLGDTMRGTSVIGASIWDSGNRWITIHSTNFLVVRDCVGYQSVGHGFFLEDGTEVDNILDRNLAVQAFTAKPLPEQNLPFDNNGGAGFWWANSHNSFTRNVAVECDRYGFRFEAKPVNKAEMGLNVLDKEDEPESFNLQLPVRMPDGSKSVVDIRTLPFVRFEDNEAHSQLYGINFGEGCRHVGPDAKHPFVFKNTKLWNNFWAFRPVSPSVLVDGMDVFQGRYGIYRPVYDRHAYSHLTIAQVENPQAFGQGDPPKGFDVPGPGDGQKPRLLEIPKSKPAQAAKKGGAPANALVYIMNPMKTYAELKDVSASSADFPALLAPVDDLPPTTVITQATNSGSGSVVVRGTTADSGTVTRVKVNGKEARALRPNFAEWEITLDMPAGYLDLTAFAEDAAGNVEPKPHHLKVGNP